jgi:hypothetical protein
MTLYKAKLTRISAKVLTLYLHTTLNTKTLTEQIGQEERRFCILSVVPRTVGMTPT